MIHLALRTEFSFKKCYLPMTDIHKYVVEGMVGIADLNNTHGHIPLEKEAKKHGFKPIYGVRLHVLPDGSKQRTCNTSCTFLARNHEGLQEIYKLTEQAWDDFYYFPRISHSVVNAVSNNVVVIAPNDAAYDYNYVALGQGYENGPEANLALDNQHYAERGDEEVYQLLAGSRKNGNGVSHKFEDCTYDQHILSIDTFLNSYPNVKATIETLDLGLQLNAEIPDAEMVRWKGSHDIEEACRRGAHKVVWSEEYEERLQYEIELIKSKGYIDYFMITADLIKHCKKTMLVGPARGSSAGSLVCYLMDITEVDPVEHNLIFERFIDINRFDLPDIDIDFPDTKREGAVKYLKHRYGSDKVKCLANTSRLKAKSAIGEFAKALGIPPFETSEVKDAIIERSSGDARAAMCITDTFVSTEPGKRFIAKYPAMGLVERIENHASHAGKHAAGILVSTLPLSHYGACNNRDDIIMMDKKDAESKGLLKVDCLGLVNLSVLEGVADQLGLPYKAFYKLPLDDENTYALFNSLRLTGVFQFAGPALESIVKQMGVRNFNDITAITALARPGALNSGGTARYVRYVTGEEAPTYHSEIHKEITGDTFGIVVYQEQMMEIARRCGGMSWTDVQTLRRASSKSLGDEFFGKYEAQFTEGAIELGHTKAQADALWNDISTSGSWSFNKSHAVSYGLISYWTAYCKANHPMEFAVATLNNTPDEHNAMKLLRDLEVNEGIDFIPVDVDTSGIGWSFKDKTLIGGIDAIKGIGPHKAKQIINARNGGKPLTSAMFKRLMNPKTPYDIVWPTRHYWGEMYTDYLKMGMPDKPCQIRDINGKGEYMFIGCLVDRNVRDLNEHVFLSKRDGEIITEHNLYLNLKVEDDSDMISCKIGKYDYEKMGRKIAEEGKVGKSWYLIKGKIFSDWRRIDVKEIICLNDYFPKGLKNGLPE